MLTDLSPPAVGCCKNGEGIIGDIGGIVVDIGVLGVEPDPPPLDIVISEENSQTSTCDNLQKNIFNICDNSQDKKYVLSYRTLVIG